MNDSKKSIPLQFQRCGEENDAVNEIDQGKEGRPVGFLNKPWNISTFVEKHRRHPDYIFGAKLCAFCREYFSGGVTRSKLLQHNLRNKCTLCFISKSPKMIPASCNREENDTSAEVNTTAPWNKCTVFLQKEKFALDEAFQKHYTSRRSKKHSKNHVHITKKVGEANKRTEKESPDKPGRHREMKDMYKDENIHSGKWFFKESEGRFMWSDTGSFVKESDGDIRKCYYRRKSQSIPLPD